MLRFSSARSNGVAIMKFVLNSYSVLTAFTGVSCGKYYCLWKGKLLRHQNLFTTCLGAPARRSFVACNPKSSVVSITYDCKAVVRMR